VFYWGAGTGYELRASYLLFATQAILPLELLHQPFFVIIIIIIIIIITIIFDIGSPEQFAWVWLQTTILLILLQD
jgi:hypothetical protein